MAVWVPDWPIAAAAQELAMDPQAPLALIHKGVVFACSGAARSLGVMRGLTHREAQYRCPQLTVARYDESADARRFEPYVRALEAAVPGVHVVRPGLVAVAARGPSRYFGGEREAAEALQQSLQGQAVSDVRVGIADGLFTAEQAARTTHPGDSIHVVESADTQSFLSPLAVALVAADDRMALLLRRLGIRTLGQFAALKAEDVQRRFGAPGLWAHQQAAGRDPARIVAREVGIDFTVTANSDTPLDRSDHIAFMIREHADTFESRLRTHRLVCTVLTVELCDENGNLHTRTWQHPRWFSPSDIVDRVRWQLDGLFAPSGSRSDERVRATESERCGIVHVRLIPTQVDEASHHETGLWGGGPDEKVHHALSRVQGVLGPEAVGTVVLTGGRGPADRQLFVPWGDTAPRQTVHDQPWPGSFSGLAPATVWSSPVPVSVLDASGESVRVSERGTWSAPPALLQLQPQQPPRSVSAWAGPWPLCEKWWDSSHSRQGFRCQIIDTEGDGWLLYVDDSGWGIEARYD